MRLSVKTSDPSDWKSVISAIATIVEEATFEAKPDGISFRGIDPSHVALVDIFLPSSSFEKYECEEDTKFGMRVDDFAKAIKRASNTDSIEIGVTDDNLLEIKIGKNKKFNLRMIEPSLTESPIPKVEFDTTLEMKHADFDRVLGDVQVVTDYLIIKSVPDGIVFSGKGDSGEASINFHTGTTDLPSLNVKDNSVAQYSLEYLNNIVKAVGDTDNNIKYGFSTKKPARLEFKLNGSGRLHFYLAPRVEND